MVEDPKKREQGKNNPTISVSTSPAEKRSRLTPLLPRRAAAEINSSAKRSAVVSPFNSYREREDREKEGRK